MVVTYLFVNKMSECAFRKGQGVASKTLFALLQDKRIIAVQQVLKERLNFLRARVNLQPILEGV